MSGTALANQLNLKATALYHSGDYRQAIQVWQEALQADPENQRAKEGIQMASLLLDEASSSLEAAPAETPTESPESPETIAKVREGIQRVREFLSASRYLDAMEICQSLLQLAPRSEAVREVLEEAREAYEAQPFIDEHLEIARQLFIQERLDEASAELQKIFFLNARHGEARKLDAKIQGLRQKLAPAPPAGEAPPEGLEPPESEGFDPSQTMRMGTAEAIEEPPVLEKPSPEPVPARAAKAEEILNEDWEAELAQLNLGPASDKPADPGEPESEPIPLMDLSEDPSASLASKPTGKPRAKHEEGGALESPELPDLSGDLGRMRASPGLAGESVEAPVQRPARERAKPARPVPAPRRERASLPLGKIFFGLIGAGILAGAGWWYLGARSASESGQGSGAGAPPIRRAPLRPQKAPSGQTSEPANVGLSGNSSRAGNAAAAGQPSGAEISATALTPEQAQKEIARLFDAGRSLMERGEYTEAAADFSKILELDPANIDAKSNLDQAASRVQEQKRLQEDLQTAKEYFLEKDFESALRKFYRLPKDQHLGELDLFIRNAWYNWAVMSMKGGNCPEALQRLDEALNSDAHDEEASKLREVADHYRDRPKDKVFYAYADRLTYRTLNQK